MSSEDEALLRRTARLLLVIPIKGESLPAGTRLVKAYGTSSGGARRVVYLLASGDGDFLLLFCRSKNDEIGKNITIKNPVFRKALQKHLAMLKTDLKSGKYKVISDSRKTF